MNHRELVERAAKWLRNIGCRVVFDDRFQPYTHNGECPDAIGWIYGSLSVVVECKASRSDFLADAKKKFRADPARGMGHWRFYLAPKGMLQVSDMPGGWGLIEATPKQIRWATPKPRSWWEAPFPDKCLLSESMMLTAALTRLSIRGRLDEIYDFDLIRDCAPPRAVTAGDLFCKDG